jgi:hypothetical protein
MRTAIGERHEALGTQDALVTPLFTAWCAVKDANCVVAMLQPDTRWPAVSPTSMCHQPVKKGW